MIRDPMGGEIVDDVCMHACMDGWMKMHCYLPRRRRPLQYPGSMYLRCPLSTHIHTHTHIIHSPM